MILLSIDPGVHRVGCALWEFKPTALGGAEPHAGDNKHKWYPRDSRLIRAELVEADILSFKHAMAAHHIARRCADWLNRWNAGRVADMVVVEYPRVYPGRKAKGDSNDIVDLAGAGCAVAAVCGREVRQTYPADWKGQVPKPIMGERIRRALSPQEEECLILTGVLDKDHNTIDAVGIGLTFANRLSKDWIAR